MANGQITWPPVEMPADLLADDASDGDDESTDDETPRTGSAHERTTDAIEFERDAIEMEPIDTPDQPSLPFEG